MKKSLKLLGILLSIVMVFLLVGCGKSDEDELLGKWKMENDDSYTIEFSEHGEGKGTNEETSYDFQYKIDGDEITISGDKSSETYKYWIKDDKLNLKILTSENKYTEVFVKVD